MISVETMTAILDWLGIITFAISGTVVASRKKMDVVGFVILGTVTGIGGGTLRDLLLGSVPVFWVREPLYLQACIAVSCLAFVLRKLPLGEYRLLLLLDAIGLALFAVTGAEKAMLMGAGPFVCVTMGVVTASFGGIMRDVLGNESPAVLSSEIYITAAAVGAGLYVLLAAVGIEREFALLGSILVGTTLRLVAISRGWSLPSAS